MPFAPDLPVEREMRVNIGVPTKEHRMLLAQSGAIGSLTLKNRVIMAPMGTNYSTTDGLSTERDKFYYEERAKGGVAAIMTEAKSVSVNAQTLDLELGAKAIPKRIELGDVLMIAIGRKPVRDVVPVLERAGVPYELIGDCYRPGDFMTAIRDAWMVALSVDQRFVHPE